jgi:hypothetical protein
LGVPTSSLGVTTGLVSYWPVVRGNTFDMNTGKILTPVGSPSFSKDRFGNENGAMFPLTSTGFFVAPNAAYFTGDFTISAWALLNSTSYACMS